MDATTGRCRGSAQVYPRIGGRVWIDAGDRPREELGDVGQAARDRPTHMAGIVALQLGGPARAACEDDVAKAGREALDLALDAVRHVHVRAERHVAIRVARVLA